MRWDDAGKEQGQGSSSHTDSESSQLPPLPRGLKGEGPGKLASPPQQA